MNLILLFKLFQAKKLLIQKHDYTFSDERIVFEFQVT